VNSVWVRIWEIFSSGAWTVIRTIVDCIRVQVREVDEIIHSLFVFGNFQNFFRFGNSNYILFIIASRWSEIASCLEFISLARFIWNTIVVVHVWPETTLHVKCTEGARLCGRNQGHLTLTPVYAHDVFLNSGSHHVFFRSGLLIIRNTSFSLVFNHSVLTFHYFITLCFHFFYAEKELFPESFIVLFEQCIFPLHIKHVLLLFQVRFFQSFDLVQTTLQIHHPLLELFHHRVMLRRCLFALLITILHFFLQVIDLSFVHFALIFSF